MKNLRHTFLFLFSLLLSAEMLQAGDCDSLKGVSQIIIRHDADMNSVVAGTGLTEETVAPAHLVLSESTPVTVDQNGSITLVAGKSIHFLPGTKISAGGFMYASIVQPGKTGRLQKKEVRLVTVEENEKLEEQVSLAQAATLLSPFPSNKKGQLHAATSENGSIDVYTNNNIGISQEQTFKLAAISVARLQANLQPIVHKFINLPGYCNNNVDCRYVLRL